MARTYEWRTVTPTIEYAGDGIVRAGIQTYVIGTTVMRILVWFTMAQVLVPGNDQLYASSRGMSWGIREYPGSIEPDGPTAPGNTPSTFKWTMVGHSPPVTQIAEWDLDRTPSIVETVWSTGPHPTETKSPFKIVGDGVLGTLWWLAKIGPASGFSVPLTFFGQLCVRILTLTP